ncbi:MAG: DMT family transporter [Pseudomonadota bacterium]|nr:DMT family transporter [Pseudomonadota bacterium]
MTVSTIGLVLLAALLHASWNAFIKSGQDKMLSLALMHICSGVICLFLLPFVSLPHPDAWPYLALSLVLHWGYYWFLVNGYRSGDLGQIYPLSRGSAPLLVAILGGAIAGETLSFAALSGIVLASLGITALSFEKGLPWHRDPRPVLFALGTGGWIAAYTVADGLGVRHGEHEFGYILWLFILEAITFGGFMAVRRRRVIRSYYLLNWRGLWISGLAAAGAYGLVIWAMSSNVMAMVSALRETSVIMAVFIGGFMLKEHRLVFRLFSASLVVTGIVVMNLSH